MIKDRAIARWRRSRIAIVRYSGAAFRIEAHEAPMRRLVVGLERQQARGDVDCGVENFLPYMVRKEPAQDCDGP